MALPLPAMGYQGHIRHLAIHERGGLSSSVSAMPDYLRNSVLYRRFIERIPNLFEGVSIELIEEEYCPLSFDYRYSYSEMTTLGIQILPTFFHRDLYNNGLVPKKDLSDLWVVCVSYDTLRIKHSGVYTYKSTMDFVYAAYSIESRARECAETFRNNGQEIHNHYLKMELNTVPPRRLGFLSVPPDAANIHYNQVSAPWAQYHAHVANVSVKCIPKTDGYEEAPKSVLVRV